jgi:hypothetical protein
MEVNIPQINPLNPSLGDFENLLAPHLGGWGVVFPDRFLTNILLLVQQVNKNIQDNTYISRPDL